MGSTCSDCSSKCTRLDNINLERKKPPKQRHAHASSNLANAIDISALPPLIASHRNPHRPDFVTPMPDDDESWLYDTTDTPHDHLTLTMDSLSNPVFANIQFVQTPQWYLDGDFTGSTFDMWFKLTTTQLHDMPLAESSRSELIELRAKIIAACATADGELSQPERHMFLTRFIKDDISEEQADLWLSSVRPDEVPMLFAEYMGIIEELIEYIREELNPETFLMENPKILFDPSKWNEIYMYDLTKLTQLELLFSAIIVGAADGLVAHEMYRLYQMGDIIGVSRADALQVTELLVHEQELFHGYHALFSKQELPVPDLVHAQSSADSDEILSSLVSITSPMHSANNSGSMNNSSIDNGYLHPHDALPKPSSVVLTRRFSIEGLQKCEGWLLESGLIGTTSDRWKEYAIAQDELKAGIQTGLNDLTLKFISAVVDGPMSELRRKRFADVQRFMGVGELGDVEVTRWNWDEMFEEWRDKYAETAKIVRRRQNRSGTIIEAITNEVGSLFATKSGNRGSDRSLRCVMLMEAIALCAVGGLKRKEMTMIYEMAEAIGVSRVTTREMTDLMVAERNLYKEYHGLFRTLHDDRSS